MDALTDWGYFAAFTPAAYYLLGATVLLAFAFLCAFIAWTYRKRQSAEYVAELIEATKPDVIDTPDPAFIVRAAEAADELPLTHYSPTQPWRHS